MLMTVIAQFTQLIISLYQSTINTLGMLLHIGLIAVTVVGVLGSWFLFKKAELNEADMKTKLDHLVKQQEEKLNILFKKLDITEEDIEAGRSG